MVLVWTKTNEAVQASINRGRILPDLRTGVNEKMFSLYGAAIRQAWDNEWHVRDVANVKVASTTVQGSAARLVVCPWNPTVEMYQKNGRFFGKPEVFWTKQTVKLQSQSGRWVITSVTFDGKCPGKPPV